MPGKVRQTPSTFSGEMISGYSRILPPKQFSEALAQNYGTEAYTTLDNTYLYSLPGPYFSVFYKDKAAIGSTVPLAGFWQLDATAPLYNNLHVTVNWKPFLKNTGVILQHPILNQG